MRGLGRVNPTAWAASLIFAGAVGGVSACSSSVIQAPTTASLQRRFRPERMQGAQRRAAELLKEHRRTKRFPAHVLLRRTVDEHILNGGLWSLQRSMVLRYVVFRPRSKWAKSFVFDVPQHWRVQSAGAFVQPLGGKLRVYRQSDLHEEKGGRGRRRFKVAYARVNEGTLIEERVVLMLTNATLDIPWYTRQAMRMAVPADRLEHHVIYPNLWRMQAKRNGPVDAKIAVNVKDYGMWRHVSAVRQNVPAFASEPLSPSLWTTGEYLASRLQYFAVGMRQARGPTHWQQLGNAVTQLLHGKRRWFDRTISEASKAIVAGKRDPWQRLLAIDRYVREQVRVDMSSRQRSFREVLRTRRGSINQVTALTVLLLREAGVGADFTLIHDARDGVFDEGFVTISELDVRAVLASVGKRTVLLFPYLRHVAPGEHPWWVQGQRAMSVRGWRKVKWWTVPVQKARHDRSDEQLEVSLSADGKVEVVEKVRFFGLAAQRMRAGLMDQRPDELVKTLWRLRRAAAAVPLAPPKIEHLHRAQLPLTVTYRYRLDHAASVAGGAMVLRPGGFLEPSYRFAYSSVADGRTRKVLIENNRMRRRTVVFRYPKSWKVSKLPKGANAATGLGSMSLRYERKGAGALKVVHEVSLKRGTYPPKQVGDLLELLGSDNRRRMPPLVFRRAAAQAKAGS